MSKTEVLPNGVPVAGPASAIECAKSESLSGLLPVDLDVTASAQYGPVLFIGIGGAATRVFRRLRQRMHDRLGAMEAIPAIELLLLDTDVKSLNKAIEGEAGTALNVNETLAMPLRRTEDYRGRGWKYPGLDQSALAIQFAIQPPDRWLPSLGSAGDDGPRQTDGGPATAIADQYHRRPKCRHHRDQHGTGPCAEATAHLSWRRFRAEPAEAWSSTSPTLSGRFCPN